MEEREMLDLMFHFRPRMAYEKWKILCKAFSFLRAAGKFVTYVCIEAERVRGKKHKIYGEILQTAAIIHQNLQ